MALVIILAFSEDCDGRSYPKRKKSDPNCKSINFYINFVSNVDFNFFFFFLQVESKTASPANKRKPREVDLESENQAVDSFMWGGHGGRGRYGGYGNSIALKGNIQHLIREFSL